MRAAKRWAAGVMVAGLAVGVGVWATAQPPGLPGSPAIPPLPAAPVRAFTVATPAGNYVREFADGERFTLRFEADRLFAEARYGDPAQPTTLFLDADYAVNKEGVVFGVLTGVACDGPGLRDESLQQYVGQPFAVRVRADALAVTVREVWAGGPNHAGLPAGIVRLALGRYTATTPEPISRMTTPAKPSLGLGKPVSVTPVGPPDLPLPPLLGGPDRRPVGNTPMLPPVLPPSAVPIPATPAVG